MKWKSISIRRVGLIIFDIMAIFFIIWSFMDKI